MAPIATQKAPMQLMQVRRRSRNRGRFIFLGVLAGIAALAYGGWRLYTYAVPRYARWKQQRALVQAREFMDKRDAASAQVALEVALKAVPGDPNALRLAADMLEQVGAPQAMRLRRAVVEAVPNSAEDAAKLVVCCIRFGDFNAAKDALSGTSPALSAQTPMLQAALAYAASTSDTIVVAALLDELRKRTPDSVELKRSEALLYLQNPSEKRREEARAQLDQIARENPALGLDIERGLASDAIRRKDYADAERRWRAIVANPKSVFNDRLQLANLELLVQKKPLEQLMPPLAKAAGTEADAPVFAQWLLVQGHGKEMLAWLDTLPAKVRDLPAVQASRVDAYAQLKDWDHLFPALEAGGWGPFPREVLKVVVAAQALDEPSHLNLRREAWDVAVTKAQTSLSALRTLQRLASLWGWTDEAERALWAIARGYPDQTWAHQALFNIFREKKRTTDMRDVLRTLRDSDPSVPRYQHDWALLTLLTEPNSTWNQAKETMKKLHDTEPKNATYITGYAFALAQAERGPEAVALVNQLADTDRDYPPRAPYLAFVYGVGKNAAGVEAAQKRGANVDFLPEETFLFSRANTELTRKPATKTPAKKN